MVLIIDDNMDIRDLIKSALAKTGFIPEVAANADEALVLIEKGMRPSLIFLDTKKNGVEFLHQLNQKFPELHTNIVTISGDDEEMEGSRIVGNVRKPLDLQSLRAMALKYATLQTKKT